MIFQRCQFFFLCSTSFPLTETKEFQFTQQDSNGKNLTKDHIILTEAGKDYER